MRFVSKATLAAALFTGSVTVALGAAPAVAQEQKGGAQIQVSKEFRTFGSAAEAAIKARDWPTAAARLGEASAVAKTDDERYFIAALGVPVAANLNDNKTLQTYLDALIANPKTPPADLPRYTFLRGNMAFEQKNWAEALNYLNRAQQGGYANENLPVMIASANLNSNNVPAGIAALDQAIKAREAAGQTAPESWYRMAVARLYQGKDMAGTAQWLARQTRAYPTPTNWHSSIAIYREGADLDRAAQIDLYRLQRSANAMASLNDYLAYATFANASGIAYETPKVIEHGRANGKIAANNSAANQLLSAANTAIKAEGSLNASETRARAAANGVPAAATANAYLASGDYAKAIDLFQLALQKGGANADEVNTRLGIAHAMANQKDQARQAFAKVTGPQRKEIANFWTLWLDIGSTGPAPSAG